MTESSSTHNDAILTMTAEACGITKGVTESDIPCGGFPERETAFTFAARQSLRRCL